jgi:O-antigen ligase
MDQALMADSHDMKSSIFLFEKASTIIVLLFTLVLGYAGGFWAAYPLMVTAVLIAIGAATIRQNLWLAGDWGGAAFTLAFVLLGIAFGINHDVAHIFNFLMLLMFAPLSAALSRHASPRNTFWVASLANIGCGVGLVISLYQVFWLHMSQASAFGSDPIWSAQAGIIIAFIAILGVMTTDKPSRFLFIIGPMAMMAAVVLSGSRGPLLAVPALFGIFILLGTRRWWLSLFVAVGSTTLLFIATAWFWPEGLERISTVRTIVVDLLSKGQITEASGGERQLMYGAGTTAFWASPLFGYGWGNLMEAITPFLPIERADLGKIHHHLHSDGLDFAVAGGLLGILSYILVLAAPCLGALRSPRDFQYNFRRAASVGLGAGYAIFGVTYLTFGYEYHTTLYVCLSAIVVGFCRDKAPSCNGIKMSESAKF